MLLRGKQRHHQNLAKTVWSRKASLWDDCQILVFPSLSVCFFLPLGLSFSVFGRLKEILGRGNWRWSDTGREVLYEWVGVIRSHRWSSRRRPSVSGSCGHGGGWAWLKQRANTHNVSTMCPLQATPPSTISRENCSTATEQQPVLSWTSTV